jgi:hypothetical protein
VQTFLPVADFRRSARLLDPRRLGKQRVEALQIMRALGRTTGGWLNHPAVRMWRATPEALARYGLDVCDAWCELGFADTCAGKITDDFHRLAADTTGTTTIRTQEELAVAGALPTWLGDERLHRSHRSALLHKDPDFYRPLFGDEPDDLPYHWPV